jgi:hypothetical protein
MDKVKIVDKRPIQKFVGCFGTLAFVCIGVCGLLYSVPYFFGQMLRTELDYVTIPTAEALLTAPTEIVVADEIHLHLWFDERTVGNNFASPSDVVCVSTHIDKETYQDYQNNSRLYIDEVWVIGASNTVLIGLTDDSLSNPPFLNWCGWGHLEAGVHLVEFHLRDSSQAEPIFVQQWAIRIGD